MTGGRGARGFTVLELLLALAVLVVVAALAWPITLGAGRAEAFDASCRAISSAGLLARSESQRLGQPVALVAVEARDGEVRLRLEAIDWQNDADEAGGGGAMAAGLSGGTARAGAWSSAGGAAGGARPRASDAEGTPFGGGVRTQTLRELEPLGLGVRVRTTKPRAGSASASGEREGMNRRWAGEDEDVRDGASAAGESGGAAALQRLREQDARSVGGGVGGAGGAGRVVVIGVFLPTGEVVKSGDRWLVDRERRAAVIEFDGVAGSIGASEVVVSEEETLAGERGPGDKRGEKAEKASGRGE